MNHIVQLCSLTKLADDGFLQLRYADDNDNLGCGDKSRRETNNGYFITFIGPCTSANLFGQR